MSRKGQKKGCTDKSATKDKHNSEPSIAHGSNLCQPMKRKFQGIWLDAEIWEDRSLLILARILYVEIRSLHDDDVGGCYASDEYLMEFLGVKRSQYFYHLKTLIDRGLVKKIKSKGTKRLLVAMQYSAEEKKVQCTGQKNPVHRTKKSSAPDKNEPIPLQAYNMENKEENKEEYIMSSASPPASASPRKKKRSFEEKIKGKEAYGINKKVWMTKERYDHYCKERGKEAFDERIQAMDDSVVSRDAEPYTDIDIAMRTWDRNDKKFFKNNSKFPDGPEKYREQAERIVKNMDKEIKKLNIEMCFEKNWFEIKHNGNVIRTFAYDKYLEDNLIKFIKGTINAHNKR